MTIVKMKISKSSDYDRYQTFDYFINESKISFFTYNL